MANDHAGPGRRWDVPYIVSSAAIAAIGVLLMKGVMEKLFGMTGNPPNMGLCMNCFLRDIAGSIGLHKADVAWYFRPEIPGLVLGAYLASLLFREHRPQGGQNGLIRFTFGAFMGAGAMMFLGCTTRMGLRLGGGDFNALVGFAGFAAGIYAGTIFIRNGFSAGDKKDLPVVNGVIFPFVAALFLALFIIFGPEIFKYSEKGPASMRAPIAVAIGAGVLAGGLAHWGRFCFMRPFRDLFLMKSGRLFGGLLVFILVATALNLAFGEYRPGFSNQEDRMAHAKVLCNLLGMFTVGLAAVFLDGCPIRQVVRAGAGDTDAAVTVMGMMAALSISDNFGITCSPKAQPFSAGVAVSIGIACMITLAFFHTDLFWKLKGKAKKI